MKMESAQPDGYLALPATGTGPGVLVLHAWWGLTDMIRGFCSRLADSGFVAFAPDLYGGQIASTIPEAEVLSDALDGQAAMSLVTQSVDFLWNHDRVSRGRLGVIGFSLGAYYALNLSAADPDRVKAVVLFYGTGGADLANAKAAYLGHFAGADPHEPADYVDQLENELLSCGLEATFYRYPEVGHWFFESDRPDAYNTQAAQLAWERTISFLRKELRD
jgi:carboxymethylenebutenolidase